MNRNQIIEAVERITSRKIKDEHVASLVEQAESVIFPSLPLAKRSHRLPMETAPVADLGYELPAGLEKVSRVVMRGKKLIHRPGVTYHTKRSVVRPTDYYYEFINDSGKRYLRITPWSQGDVVVYYITYEPSLNPIYNKETRQYANNDQTNLISQQYSQVYIAYIAYLIFEQLNSPQQAAQQQEKFNATLRSAVMAENSLIREA